MSWSRLLPILLGFLLVLGLSLWFLDSFLRLYSSAASLSPLLGNLVLLLLVLGLAALLGILIYYLGLFGRSKQPKPQIVLPVEKTEVAQETLQAVRQQVAQIQDEVARQALLQRSQELEANWLHRPLQIVVFGTGSAGKTSLINAILGRIAGQVGPTIGTTATGTTHHLRLKGLDREIWITDTPGLQEVGIAGTDREQQARQLATEADLLLLVVDNDLRQSEYASLQALMEIGKRSLVVFNKTDLFPEADREAVLTRIRQRVQSFISAQDVIAVAARPQAVQLDTGEWISPEPDIVSLLRRMAAVLRSEGEDLIADNILLQSQRLGEEARQLLDSERRQQAEQIVDRFQWIAAGLIAATPIPVVDLLAAAAVNAQMVVEIAKVYGCDLNIERGKELAISLAKTLVSLGVVRGALELFSLALQTNVGTFLVGRAIQGVTAAYLTRIAGKSFIEYFRRNQDWGDGGMTEVVQEQFRLNRRDEFIRKFVQEAIDRVITAPDATTESRSVQPPQRP